ncbi:hypothetical protein KPSA3_06628 [Pseudomonas syringae pv. actinidiae]|uniref:Uncharacterized protein n=1 Tax=Pseudomonas syringae pv. actinidiae TaxID=103796 RepID=A0AAN4TPP5_PSESF|nr:hypothetical protein KPSA3_06628 [Pseudomonas syringae pv. actinidiae]
MLMDFDCNNLLAYKAGQVTCVQRGDRILPDYSQRAIDA